MELSSIDSDRFFLPVINNANSLAVVCISASESKELIGSSSISNLPLELAIRSPFKVPKLTANVCEGLSEESVVLNQRLISSLQKYSAIEEPNFRRPNIFHLRHLAHPRHVLWTQTESIEAFPESKPNLQGDTLVNPIGCLGKN